MVGALLSGLTWPLFCPSNTYFQHSGLCGRLGFSPTSTTPATNSPAANTPASIISFSASPNF